MSTALTTPHQQWQSLVQQGPAMIDGMFLSGAFTLLAAGPPRLSNIGGTSGIAAGGLIGPTAGKDYFFPLGVIQNFNLSQNKNFSRLFELGSERSVIVPGRTMGQIGLSRVLYHGPSFLRVLYAYYQDLLPPTMFPPVLRGANVADIANVHNTIIEPGFENLFINLASDLFNNPIGLLWFMRDSNELTYGAAYFECCVIPNHTLATDANGVIIQESVALQYERIIPVGVKAIALITGDGTV